MASKPTRTKAPAVKVTVPQSREEANAFIRAIGANARDLARIEAAMNDEMAALKERFESQAQPLKDENQALTNGVQIWCEANRDTLTKGGKVKTAALPAGEIGWRMRPPSCRITGKDAVIEALHELGLERFIRTQEEPNKEAMLNEPDVATAVPGIAINQGEDFFVQPFETELAEAA